MADEDDATAIANYSVSDEYLQFLLQSETPFGFHCNNNKQSSHWHQFTRFNAISSILKNRDVFGFHYQTAYLAITYFDQFLSIREIDSEKTWAIQLLSIACLSLAAKMEECKVPTLSEFRFDESDDYGFGGNVIKRMELMVLNTLEWRMNFVTPFYFLHFFITNFSSSTTPTTQVQVVVQSPQSLSSSSSSSVVVSRTVELILDFIKDVNSMSHRPSVIAGAATLMALDSRLTKQALELKINHITSSLSSSSSSSSPSCGFLPIEDIWLLYEMMQKQDILKQQQQQQQIPSSIVVSPDVSPSRFDTRGNSSTTPATNTNRKRLTFSDHHQNDGSPDEKRRRL